MAVQVKKFFIKSLYAQPDRSFSPITRTGKLKKLEKAVQRKSSVCAATQLPVATAWVF
jgi:hypothetical protein